MIIQNFSHTYETFFDHLIIFCTSEKSIILYSTNVLMKYFIRENDVTLFLKYIPNIFSKQLVNCTYSRKLKFHTYINIYIIDKHLYVNV